MSEPDEGPPSTGRSGGTGKLSVGARVPGEIISASRGVTARDGFEPRENGTKDSAFRSR